MDHDNDALEKSIIKVIKYLDINKNNMIEYVKDKYGESENTLISREWIVLKVAQKV